MSSGPILDDNADTQVSKRQCPSEYDPMSSNLTSLTLSNLNTDADHFSHPFFHPTDLNPWVYRNVLASAPMVRISTLPFRLACKAHGANMLYSEELVAKKLATCTRITNAYDLAIKSDPTSKSQEYNEDIDVDRQYVQRHAEMIHFLDPINVERSSDFIALNKDSTTGEYVHKYVTPPTTHEPAQEASNGQLLRQFDAAAKSASFRHLNTFNLNSVLSTYPNERLVVQLGVGNAIDAVQAVEVVGNDVRGIDLNLGCPKLFSTQGLFGSELLHRPEIVEDMIKALKRNFNIPITIKIRMLPEVSHTIELLRRAEHCGVDAIAVHCRYKPDRPRYQALPLMQMPILASIATVPLLYNGDIYSYHEIEQYKHISRGCWCTAGHFDALTRSFKIDCACGSAVMNAKGVQGVLIGRGAMHNPAVFGHYLPNPGDSWDQYNNLVSQLPLPQFYDPSLPISPDASTFTPITDQIWDPIQRLLTKEPQFNNFIHQQLYNEYREQFTNPFLTAQRAPYHHQFQQHRFEPYEHPPTRSADTYAKTGSEYSNFNPNKPHMGRIKDEEYHLFWKDTWPTVDEEYFRPRKATEFNDLLKEIDQAIVNREEKQQARVIDTTMADESIASVESSLMRQNLFTQSDDGSRSNSADNGSANPNPSDNSSSLECDSFQVYPDENWSQYAHRSKPYQHSNPALNPTHRWEFNQSYTLSKLMVPNTFSQPRTLPSFYPTSLVVLSFGLLNNLLSNSKYIIGAMVKHNNQITKDPSFRMVTSAKTNADLLNAIYALRTNNCFHGNYFHPQIVTKHELRPLPKPPAPTPSSGADVVDAGTPCTPEAKAQMQAANE